MVIPAPSVPSLQTGDLLLFAGRGLVSATIRLFTRSRWSHIAMIVRLPGDDRPLVLEAMGSSESADLHLGRPVNGVALVPLADKLRDYPGEIVVRRRLGPPPCPRRQRLVARLVRRLLHRPYKNFLWCNALDLLSGYTRPPDRRGWFCSELVAEMYRRLGWLPRDARVAGFVPGDFDAPRLAGELGPPERLKAWRGFTASAVPAGDTPATDPRSGGHETLLPRRSREFA
ncbi:MAG: hypothetical protein MK005_12860 [Alcanivorax sp.]|nr:hypothetical protein [Alcanivorax sp.]